MKLLVFSLLTVLLFSCENKPANDNNASGNSKSLDLIKDTVAADTASTPLSQPIIPPGKEDAETLVAMYYSARNRELKYPFYKGLGLEILEIKSITGTDSFRVEAKVTGRKWPNPNKDTLTLPFEENRTIRTIKTERGWLTDSISLK
jgi:hypothetical protein